MKSNICDDANSLLSIYLDNVLESPPVQSLTPMVSFSEAANPEADSDLAMYVTTKSPARRSRKPKRDRSLLVYPDPCRLKDWHDALRPDIRLLASTVLSTGIRVGECQSLAATWASRQTGPSGAAVAQVRASKGVVPRSSRGVMRAAYVPATLREELDSGLRGKEQFCRANGTPWTLQAISRAFGNAAEDSGYPVTPLLLRRVYRLWVMRSLRRLMEQNRPVTRPLAIADELLGGLGPITNELLYLSFFDGSGSHDMEAYVSGPIEDLIELMPWVDLRTANDSE
jgi:hypothetical protein